MCSFIMHYSNKITPYILLLSCLFCGCSNTTTYTSPSGQGISMTLAGLYPSRAGESYALWLEFPKNAIGNKQNQIQHSGSIRKLVSVFRVSSDGSVTGMDTTNLVVKLGFPLALANHAIISVERTDSIGSTSRAAFLGGDITGDVSTGTSTLQASNDDGLNFGFTTLQAAATLANAPGKPANELELYLMHATSQVQTSPSINSLPLLPDPWHYALWAVDSSVKTLPPFNIYYGTFILPGGIPPDSKPEDNHYNYPGGRYPADSTKPCYDLHSGRVAVMMTLEPIADGVRPATPFGAIILQTTIPATAQGFSPIDLTNIAALFPTVSLIIHR